MPIPTPRKGESQQEFISRCMGNPTMRKEFPDQKQRSAVCFSTWRRRNKSFNDFHVRAPVSNAWEEEVVIKSAGKTIKSKQKFIEVTVSGLKEDRDGEMMSQESIDDMIMQFKSGTLPFFPDHGRDEKTGQPHVYSWKQIMGVWTDARQEGDKLLAVVRLNKAHPDAELFWNYIQEKMPIGFSIGGNPVEEPKYIELDVDEEPEVEKKKITNMEAERKKRGMSVSEFYAAPRDPPSASALPIFDEAHVRNAMARFNQTKFRSAEEKAKARRKIIAAARKFGIDPSGFIEATKSFVGETETIEESDFDIEDVLEEDEDGEEED